MSRTGGNFAALVGFSSVVTRDYDCRAEFVGSRYNASMPRPDADNDLTLTSLKADREALLARWNDGVVQRIPWRMLRDNCPCATCRTSRAEAKPAPLFNILKPEEVGPIRATAMVPIGNYAYQIDFSDGHKTGIFALELLREIGEGQAGEP